MACLSIRLAISAALAASIAFTALPCKAQTRSQHAESADDEYDLQEIIVPASSRGLRLQTAADEQAEQAILAALARPISVAFSDTPLRDVRQAFQSQLGVNVLADAKALSDAGVTEDTTIQFSAQSLSARAVLQQVLSQKELNWLIQGGAIVITTNEVAKTRTETRVYPVADLTLAIDQNGGYTNDFDSLIELGTSTVSPASWSDNGGNGSVAPHAASGTLVISQTREVHEQVAMLLDALRTVRHSQGLDAGLRNLRREVADVGITESEAPAETEGQGNSASAAANRPVAQPQWRMPHVYH
jgi:hypothetical protein